MSSSKGHIEKRGSSWRIIVDLPRKADGLRNYYKETVRGTKKEAQDRLNKLLVGRLNTNQNASAKETVAEYLKSWLDRYHSQEDNNTVYNTQRNYRSKMENHVIPELGHLQLRNLTSEILDDFFFNLLAKGSRVTNKKLEHSSIHHIFTILQNALNMAVKSQRIPYNPCASVEALKKLKGKYKRKGKSLTAEQCRLLIAAAEGSPCKDAFVFAVHTGLRRSEIFGLQWKNVDLENHTIDVVQGLQRHKGKGLVITEPKTDHSKKKGHKVSSTVLDLLIRIKEEQRLKMKQWGTTLDDDCYVFTHLGNKPFSPDYATREFARIALKVGIKIKPGDHMTLHSLRHTTATLMDAEGVSTTVISRALRHANVAFTMNTYVHPSDERQEEAAEKLGKLLANN